MSAIDAKMKFALTLNYKRITSVNMKDFYQRFKSVYPGTIKVWQSDNGSENQGEFDRELEKDQVPHLFIYPNCPQIDTFIERYNRQSKRNLLITIWILSMIKNFSTRSWLTGIFITTPNVDTIPLDLKVLFNI